MISENFNQFSHALRSNVENYLRAKQLFAIDRDEAVANFELGMTNVLNTFHSLYDACNMNASIKIDWHGIPELMVVLSVRNAKHHNHSNKIRSFFSVKAKEIIAGLEKRTLLVNFPKQDAQVDCIDFYINWLDLDSYLIQARKNIKKEKLEEGSRLIRSYLNADVFEAYANRHNLTFDDVYINLVPLVMNAGITLYPSIKDFIKPLSTESEIFNCHFRDESCFDTRNHQYQILDF